MLEQKSSISRFQTHQPATDKTQIQGIPGILLLITILSSTGRAVSYCIRSLSNSIPLMNSSHPDNGMNSLQPVWAAASHPRSLGALASPGFGPWPVPFHCQPPWCWLPLSLCQTNCLEFCPTPLLDPATAIWAAVSAHSSPLPPSILLFLHCFAWVTSWGPESPSPAVFWARAMLTQKLCSTEESRQKCFAHCCLLLSICSLTTQPIEFENLFGQYFSIFMSM